jgi:hypothetical protein
MLQRRLAASRSVLNPVTVPARRVPSPARPAETMKQIHQTRTDSPDLAGFAFWLTEGQETE